MDKNTITGFLLIAVVMIAFMVTQKPNEEQLRERKRIQDSIQQVESDRARLQAEQAQQKAVSEGEEADVLADFFGGEAPASEDTTAVVEQKEIIKEADEDTSSAFKSSVDNTDIEEYVTIENDDLRLTVSTKGGWMHSAELKEFKRYDKDTLFLFKGEEARFNLELFNKRSVRLNTESETFTPILSDNGKTLTMRLGYTSSQYIDFVYTLPETGYLFGFDIFRPYFPEPNPIRREYEAVESLIILLIYTLLGEELPDIQFDEPSRHFLMTLAFAIKL